jgi:hypothetical protein
MSNIVDRKERWRYLDGSLEQLAVILDHSFLVFLLGDLEHSYTNNLRRRHDVGVATMLWNRRQESAGIYVVNQ